MGVFLRDYAINGNFKEVLIKTSLEIVFTEALILTYLTAKW